MALFEAEVARLEARAANGAAAAGANGATAGAAAANGTAADGNDDPPSGAGGGAKADADGGAKASAAGEELEAARALAQYARLHRDVVARWGRFPHRNAALGRPSTAEEAAGLADGSIRGF